MNSGLNTSLASIGILLGGVATPGKKAIKNFDIEQVLLDAAGQIPNDGRLASLLFSWIKVHARHVIVEKLRKILRKSPDENKPLAISTLAAYAVEEGEHKWKKLIYPKYKDEYLFNSKSAQSAVKLKGAELWAKNYGILIASGSIRIRVDDIMSVEQLAGYNKQYCNRLLFGASWRADIITAIQRGANTATEIMKQVGCSYEPAHRIRHEYLLAKQVHSI